MKDDTISRKAAIDALRTHERKASKKWLDNQLDIEWNNAIDICCYDIEDLPSVQPKHGYWIESHEHIYIANGVREWTNWYCSECDAPNDKPTDYCPNCGADMRGEQDDAQRSN